MIGAAANRLIRYHLHDLVMFIRWRNQRGDLMSADEFVARLAQQRTGIGMLRVVSTVRQNNLLDQAGDLTNLVLDLEELATSESLLKDEAHMVSGQPACRVGALDVWLEPSHRRCLRALREAGPDLVDELAQLMQETAATRERSVLRDLAAR